jgi:hypothetical protein
MVNEKGEPMTVMLLSGDTKAAQMAEQQIAGDYLKRAARTRNKGLEITPEMTEAHERIRFRARVVGWGGWMLNGKPFEFNDANMTALLEEQRFGVLKRMIQTLLNDDALFLPRMN